MRHHVTACLTLGLLFAFACGDSDAGETAVELVPDAGAPTYESGPSPSPGPPPSEAGVPLPPPGGPLAGLPSPEGAHIPKIKALGPNAWISLGSPTGDPKWGTARGRSWGGRAFALAPDIRGAFFFGEGVHGYVKPDGHIMDDLWVYDISANHWVTVFPGTNTATFSARVKSGELKYNAAGQLVGPFDEPMPMHTLVHAWGYLSYDSAARKFSFFSWHGDHRNGDSLRYMLGNGVQMEEGISLLESQAANKTYPPLSPFYFDVSAGTFKQDVISTGRPNVGGFPEFHYVASKKKYFLLGSSGAATYDPATRTWAALSASGPGPAGNDLGGAVDTKRDRIFVGTSAPNPICILDIATSTWVRPSAKGTPPPGISGNSSHDMSMVYDKANDLLQVLQYTGRKVYTFDPKTETWTSVAFPATVPSGRQWSAFHDPDLNATFAFGAHDSEDDGEMWVYRHR